MVLVTISEISTAQQLVSSALDVALKLQKSFALYADMDTKQEQADVEQQLHDLLPNEWPLSSPLVVRKGQLADVALLCEELEVSFLFMQQCDKRTSTLKKQLAICRNLRIPYLFFRNDFEPLQLGKVLLPVNFLEEEVEKAQFAAAFGRFCDSQIVMMTANDYGSKAATNTARMCTLFDKFQLPYTQHKAQKDSFKVDAEALNVAKEVDAGLIIVSASRDYGLDDIIFGPKELHLLKKTTVPLLLINPRGDLYALCD